MSGLHEARPALWIVAAATLACGLGGCAREEPAAHVPAVGDPVAGRMAIRAHGCAACHAIPGIHGPRGAVGPPLAVWSRRAYIAGHFPNEPDRLMQWLRDPPAMVPGTAMPATGVTEREARDIAAYLLRLE